MSDVTTTPQSRYRRRIVGLGVSAFVVIFGVGAAIAVVDVQDELRSDVDGALAAAGVTGVEVSFSGQDGTLRCSEPLAEPTVVRDLAAGVEGVRRVELADGCAVAASGVDEATVDSLEDPPVPLTDPPDDDDDASVDPTDAEVAAVEPVVDPEVEPDVATAAETAVELETVLDVIDRDPLFTTLSAFLSEAGLRGADALGGLGGFTVLAPTDAAFDAAFEELGADSYQALVDDPELLRELLLHHVAEGALTSAEMSEGALAMLDGTDVTVDVDPAADPIVVEFTSGDETAVVVDPLTQLDIVASNGVVHAIDRLLVPADVAAQAEPMPVEVTAVRIGALVRVRGVVRTETQREAVTLAASSAGTASLDDQVVVDPSAPVRDDDIDRFVAALGALNAFVSGEVRLDGADVSLDGVTVDELSATILEDFGSTNDVSVEVTVREVADATSAQELEAELDAFVTAQPVRFETDSADLTPDSNDVLVGVARRVLALDEISLDVVGHTDSVGTPAVNQQLSQERADQVRLTLVLLGLDPNIITARGVGGTEPILVDGVEDGDASRRVEFLVGVTG